MLTETWINMHGSIYTSLCLPISLSIVYILFSLYAPPACLYTGIRIRVDVYAGVEIYL